MIAARNETARKLLHMASGLPVFLLGYVPTWSLMALILIALAVSWQTNDLSIHLGIKRPLEGLYWNGPAAYAVGVLLTLMLMPVHAAATGWILLAFGDGAATLIGRRWPVKRWGSGRSVGGSLAFAVAGIVVLMLWRAVSPHGAQLSVASAVVATAVALTAECWIDRVDDNISVSLSAAIAVYLVDQLGRALG